MSSHSALFRKADVIYDVTSKNAVVQRNKLYLSCQTLFFLYAEIGRGERLFSTKRSVLQQTYWQTYWAGTQNQRSTLNEYESI